MSEDQGDADGGSQQDVGESKTPPPLHQDSEFGACRTLPFSMQRWQIAQYMCASVCVECVCLTIVGEG